MLLNIDLIHLRFLTLIFLSVFLVRGYGHSISSYKLHVCCTLQFVTSVLTKLHNILNDALLTRPAWGASAFNQRERFSLAVALLKTAEVRTRAAVQAVAVADRNVKLGRLTSTVVLSLHTD